MVSANERKLRQDLAQSEKKLVAQTRQLDQVELALISSDQELDEIQVELSEFIAKLASLTLKLFRRTTQLDQSKLELEKRTEELQASNKSLHLLAHEKECFLALLRDLSNPILGNTRILQYIAAGKASPSKEPELLNLLIGFNKSLLTETDHLTAAFLQLSERTTQLGESKVDLNARTEALGEANAELNAMKSVMQQREYFVAALTHDLKSPLIACSRILGFISDGTIKMELHPKLLSQLIQTHKSMLNLIWNMMDVYKSDLGCQVPVPERFDLGVLLKQCVSEFAFAIKEKKIELNVNDVGEAPYLVTTDRRLLSRVIMNLLDNAVKFTPESGQLNLTVSRGHQQTRLAIRNSGPTMTEIERERVFDRFCQTARGRQYGVGSGLGLFLAKQIMEALGGQIQCSSIELAGTEFVISLNS